jgi:hypothetical protein
LRFTCWLGPICHQLQLHDHYYMHLQNN